MAPTQGLIAVSVRDRLLPTTLMKLCRQAAIRIAPEAILVELPLHMRRGLELPSWRFWGGDQPIQEWLISTNILSPRFEIDDCPALEQFPGFITE